MRGADILDPTLGGPPQLSPSQKYTPASQSGVSDDKHAPKDSNRINYRDARKYGFLNGRL
jgi:hypothetical protein